MNRRGNLRPSMHFIPQPASSANSKRVFARIRKHLWGPDEQKGACNGDVRQKHRAVARDTLKVSLYLDPVIDRRHALDAACDGFRLIDFRLGLGVAAENHGTVVVSIDFDVHRTR